MTQKKVIIVGLGPAGLFAAKELIEHGFTVTVLEKGKGLKERTKKDLLFGVGGAGLFSDGKLCFNPFIGGDLTEFVNLEGANSLIQEVHNTFKNYGMNNGYAHKNLEDLHNLRDESAKCGIRFVEIMQKHIGSDYLVNIVDNFCQDLIKKGVEIQTETEVLDVVVGNNQIKELVTNTGLVSSDYYLFCVGRYSSVWFNKIAQKIDLETQHRYTDIGVRIETLHSITKTVTDIQYDPKFHIYTNTYDDFIRTFCTNPEGFVVTETYEKFVNVNGHAMKDKKSTNTNFAFLVRVKLTEPIEDTTSYANLIGKLANFLGGGKPILQRLGDLKKGRRSTWQKIEKNLVQPTLNDVTPGDISLLLPHRIVTDIVEGLEKLDKIIPGINSDSTLIYAPEIKLCALRIVCNKDMKTKSFENLFVAGDGAGVSGSIVAAASTGLIAARGIIKRK
ncbi:MAG: FAD-dependent oxidoreductase [Candidatus Diapherotrites archaeon CG08_land_8_20_14_0_20_30_16]|nr:MAG: FAD-dependent oxidoreductase [Candidatus Diapherotrites archaeon CG08_land_8_20_14_0_20_30_16]